MTSIRSFQIAFMVTVLGCLLALSTASAQSYYPMIMSLKPTAAQRGKTSILVISSRYSMFGAGKVWVSGKGVTGKVVTPMTKNKKGMTKNKKGKASQFTKIQVAFNISANALPGVRDFRIATPNGTSTLGQLLIVRDNVIFEQKKNNTMAEAQEVKLPATLCGAFEQVEDVDFYKFHAKAGERLSFHVQCARLQDRIHDMQLHADPILSIKSSTGNTVTTSDNAFFADPFISHTFKEAGDYFLEIRDVRYLKNEYWQYSVEINDRPFITTLFPLGIPHKKTTAVQVVGHHFSSPKTTIIKLAKDVPLGIQKIKISLDKKETNPVAVVVHNLPQVIETTKENNSFKQSQKITVPVGISGRIEKPNDIDCFTFQAKKGEKYSFEVIARRAGSAMDSIICILDKKGKRQRENDDLKMGMRTFADSWLENFEAPADGLYTVEIRDIHLRGGEDFVYFLKITKSKPYFELYLDTDKTQLTPGTKSVLFVNAVRKNGFEGDIQLHINGLPAGITASCGRILTKNKIGAIILSAAPNSKPSISNIKVHGTAKYLLKGQKPLLLRSVDAIPCQETYKPGGGRGFWHVKVHTVSVAAPQGIRSVKLKQKEIKLTPGGAARVDIEIVRAKGFNKSVQLDPFFQHLRSTFGKTLPPGITVDVKKSKTILKGKETKGYIVFKANSSVPPFEKQHVSITANISINFVMKSTYSSDPLFVTMLKSPSAKKK